MAFTFTLRDDAPTPDAFAISTTLVTLSLPRDLIIKCQDAAATVDLTFSQWCAVAIKEAIKPDLTDLLLANLELRAINRISNTRGHSMKLPNSVGLPLTEARDYLRLKGYKGMNVSTIAGAAVLLKAIKSGLLPG